MPKVSLQVAAAPGQAIAQLGGVLAEFGTNLYATARESERQVVVGKRVTDAVVDAETWLLNQRPYDEEGNSIHEELVTNWDEYWSQIVNNATTGVSDPKAQNAIQQKLQAFGAQKVVEVAATAQTWNIKHQLSELYDTLDNMSYLATASPGSIGNIVDVLEDTLVTARKTGLISVEKQAQLLEVFTKQMVTGRVRSKIVGNDFLGASDDIRQLRRFHIDGKLTIIDLNTQLQLEEELVAAENKYNTRIIQQRKNYEQGLAFDFLMGNKAGQPGYSLEDLDAVSGPDGLITDPDLYLKTRKAAITLSPGASNQPVKWDAYLAYSRGEFGPDYLLTIASNLTFDELKSMAPLALNTAQIQAKQGKESSMFNHPAFKAGIKHIEDRLMPQGRFAQRTRGPIEQVILPLALKDFTDWAINQWMSQDPNARDLDYKTSWNKADQIARRAESTMPNREGLTIKNAPTPNYTTTQAIVQAYSGGEFGPLNSESASSQMVYELRRLDMWNKRQSYERAESAESNNQNREREEVRPPSLGDRLRNLNPFGD